MEKGKNPGLGVRAIHEEGITGKGIKVAIIDQNICATKYHPEYDGKIVEYKDFGCEALSYRGSMHGPAVASLLVGENIGVAPGSELYFAAVPSWKNDAKYYADALWWIIEKNKELPKNDKIKVVSISAAPSEYNKNTDDWKIACEKARENNILVLDCSGMNLKIQGCYYDINDPDDISKCKLGFPSQTISMKYDIYAPASFRTVAEHRSESIPSYQYTGNGGVSWAMPYIAGVLALGWQVNYDLLQDEIIEILSNTTYDIYGYTIVNPKAFIDKVKESTT